MSGPVVPAAAQRVGGLLLPRAVAGHPALELCNTLAGWGEDGPGEYLTTYDHLAVWSATVGLVPAATARRLRRAAAQTPGRAADALTESRALRADFYAVLTRPRPPRPALDRLTERVQDAGAANRVGWSRSSGLGLEPGTESLDLPVRAFAGAARRLVEDGLAGQVRRCPGAGCGWLFLDEGRGRRWCVMAICGNRAKARRHAARQRSGLS
ncbi:MAG TPA: CGNR zinc finger domain-containing protein [Actinomycetes bacterium]|nr:CGNR zinc finger domain-containing protein [Actinomycetes bacterium]